MSVTVSRLYNKYADAQVAIRDLEQLGIAHADISIVANNGDGWYDQPKAINHQIDRDRDGADDRAEGSATGIGSAVGVTAGVLAGLGIMAIPGVGPVVAVGWLAVLAAGATVGGVIGALTHSGVSEPDAHVYAEGIRRGGTLVTARVPDARRAECEAVLDRAAANIGEVSAALRKSGWNRFDPTATPYTAEQIRKERELSRT